MSVIDCPVCGRPVNAGAIRCPECGGDPRLPADEARAEVAARRILTVERRQEPPLPGWSRRRRVLAAIPALALPTVLAAAGVYVFVQGWRFYFSLPVAERGDGDPIANDADMYFGVAVVLAALVLAALAAGATWPRRLDTGLGVTLLAVSSAALGLAVWATASLALGRWGVGACLLLAYVPTLIVVRLVWQSSVGQSSGGAMLADDARPNKRINLTRPRVSVVTSDRSPRRLCARR